MAIIGWLKGMRGRSACKEAAHKTYITTVAQARLPAFYADLDVADTLEGRFDLIVLHAGLLFRRFRRMGEAGTPLSDKLFTVMFDDMDQNLREMGVGDMGVGKRVKKMAQAFYGRCKAYDDALDSSDATDLLEAIQRNVYGPAMEDSDNAKQLTGYVRDVVEHLDGLEDRVIIAGDVSFPPLSTMPSACRIDRLKPENGS